MARPVLEIDMLSGLPRARYQHISEAARETGHTTGSISKSMDTRKPIDGTFEVYVEDDGNMAFSMGKRPVLALDLARRGSEALTAFISVGQVMKCFGISRERCNKSIRHKHVFEAYGREYVLFELERPDERLKGVDRRR